MMKSNITLLQLKTEMKFATLKQSYTVLSIWGIIKLQKLLF